MPWHAQQLYFVKSSRPSVYLPVRMKQAGKSLLIKYGVEKFYEILIDKFSFHLDSTTLKSLYTERKYILSLTLTAGETILITMVTW
jgi:hypothetical protein